jgi:hypothetical protein
LVLKLTFRGLYSTFCVVEVTANPKICGDSAPTEQPVALSTLAGQSVRRAGRFSAMRHRGFGVGVLGFVLAAFMACKPEGPRPIERPEEETMAPADARAFIADVQKQRGVAPGAPVTNMDELLDVIQGDDTRRFESAARLVDGKPGIDALVIHATVELVWSDALSTVARIVEEQRKRADANEARLTQQKDAGRKLSDQQETELAQAKKDVAFDGKAKVALDVLAKDHLATAGDVVNEALRQFPEDGRTYRVAAYYYLLAGDWQHFDVSMTWLKSAEKQEGRLQYLRGMEALTRYEMAKDANGFFHEALRIDPKLVRAQAKLMLTETGIDAIHRELENLRALAPQHPIVTIAGPSITSEFETATAFTRARDARQPPSAASASPPNAAPAPTAPAPAAPPASAPPQ